MLTSRPDGLLPAIQWGRSFSSDPVLCSSSSGWDGALLRRWLDTPFAVDQPKLDHHYLVLHLGGAKHVTRRRDGPSVNADVELASITAVKAGAAHSWFTRGPTDFAHMYIKPSAVDHVVQEHFDRDPRSVELNDCVGSVSPLLSALFVAMLSEVEAPGPVLRLKLDTLFQAVLVQLICELSTLSSRTPTAQHSLAPSRLRRVLDFIEAHLGDEIALDDLAAVAGSSRFHFSRAFRDATGFAPYRYLVNRRIDGAKTLLLKSSLSVEQISAQSGFKSNAQFAVMFKQVFGTTPSRFRRQH